MEPKVQQVPQELYVKIFCKVLREISEKSH